MASSDQQRKDRIVSHMNRDHKESLTHYLRHYAAVSASDAQSASLKDITLTDMTITSADGAATHIVPINPPLQTYGDARVRLVEMDTAARQGLGLSDVLLTEYMAPYGFQAVVFGAVAFYFICYATLPWMKPGTAAWKALDSLLPGKAAAAYAKLVKKIFWPVMAIHITEMILLERTRMQPYGVQRFSSLWWKWQLSCFIEGFGTFKRTKMLVEKKRAEKESKSH